MGIHYILERMIYHIVRLDERCSGRTLEEFLDDIDTLEIGAFNVEHLGEEANSLPKEFTDKYPEIPWKQIRGMRNRIAHNYYGMAKDILWQIINEDIPILREQIQEIINDYQ